MKCSFGYFFNQDRKCTQSNPNCKTFNSDNGYCTSCFPGFEISGIDCVRASEEELDPNCNEYNNGDCLKCSFGYYFNDFRRCTLIPVDCANFDIPNRICRQCYSGFSLDSENKCV